jgi:flagellar basal body P-ring formation protein FlgA
MVLVFAAAATLAAAPSPDEPFLARASAAIAQAVRQRMGPEVDVAVDEIAVTAAPVAGEVEATPAPGARTGRPSHFSLTVTTASGPRRVGSAMATVRVEGAVLRAARALARGDVLSESDVVVARGRADRVALRRLPAAAEIAGARVTRAVPEGEVLAIDVLALQPAVRSGQQVRLRATVGGVVAHGVAVATENGRLGEVVRVVNTDSKRTLTGRVVGAGEVEVRHGS